MNNVLFTCTQLQNTNKVGNLKKTDKGYYRMIVGALNMFNSAGQFYTAQEAKALFEESSTLMRRVRRGALRGEYGHPRQNGMSNDAFARRVMDIDEKSVACHHMNLELSFDELTDESGKPVVAIFSEVSPNGPYGHILEKQLQNPNENVCFSIRAFTRDFMVMGVCNRELKTVITFDYVNEPGMSIANKYANPALEAHEEVVFSRGTLESAIKQAASTGYAAENTVMTAHDLFQSMGWNNTNTLESRINNSAPWMGW